MSRIRSSKQRLRRAAKRNALPATDDKFDEVRRMFDAIAPRYDLVNRIMTFGMDRRWRRRMVDDLALPEGALVADLACGTGDLCRELARRGHDAIGVDFSEGMLAAARTPAPLVRGDVLRLPFVDGSLDGVTCGLALRNFGAIEPFLAAVAAAVRPTGRFALLEVDAPAAPLVRWGHRIYFNRIVPLIGGAISSRQAYRYLPASVSYLPPPSTLASMIGDAGFVEVEHRALSAGIVRLFTATRDEAVAGRLPSA